MTYYKRSELYGKLRKAFCKDTTKLSGILSLCFEECLKFINDRANLTIDEIEELFLERYFPESKKEVLEVLNEASLDAMMADSSL